MARQLLYRPGSLQSVDAFSRRRLVRDALRRRFGQLGATRLGIELFDRPGFGRQHRELVVLHLRDPAIDEVRLLRPARRRDPEFAHPNLRQQRCTIRENPDLPIVRGKHDLRDLLIDNLLLGRNDNAIECHDRECKSLRRIGQIRRRCCEKWLRRRKNFVRNSGVTYRPGRRKQGFFAWLRFLTFACCAHVARVRTP